MTDHKILIASNAPALQATAPDVTVEAEFGDAVVHGRLLTMAHHGPRAGQLAPCAYKNGCVQGAAIVGLSHVDLDTIGGVAAVLGRKPDAPSFWRLAEFVDLNGPHKLGTAIEVDALDLRRLHAYWSFSAQNKVFAPRDGSVADVTKDVLKHVEAVEKILAGDEDMLAAGDAFKRIETAANKDTFVSLVGGVIFRRSASFVNHLYVTPDGVVAKGVVTWNPGADLSGGAVTMSLADPVPGVNCGAILKDLFGPEAGGHAGIGGSPRGKPLPESEALRAVQALAAKLV